MKKICIITATRAEYGYLKYLIDKIYKDSFYDLQLVVTGAHLLQEQGNTIDVIRQDGYPITYTVDAGVDNSSEFSIALTMSRYAEGFAEAFKALSPDIVFVLGDRYELLPICSAAFMMRIPIAHISGGDVTEGALDDGVRNAVTMLATYHFPGTEDSAKNIERMRGSKENIFTVGEPTLDFYTTEKLLDRSELAQYLNIDVNKKWVLMTYHPETTKSLEYNLISVKNIIEALKDIDDNQVVVTKSNMDYGGKEINEYLADIAENYPCQFKLFASLGQQRYLSFMKQASLVIGNSSSGIVETPFLSVPTVNVGERQKGRYQCKNILQTSSDIDNIRTAIAFAFRMPKTEYDDKFYWGNGKAAEKIIKVLYDRNRKIGGEFEIPPPSISIGTQVVNICDSHYLYSSGRSALYAILQNIKLHFSKVNTVLVPEYLCESILNTILAANFNYRFYHVNTYLEPDYSDLISKITADSCMLIINYFGGIDTEKNIKILKSKCKELCVILDNVQAFYEMHDSTSADYTFTSFRKWFAVPDGGWVKTLYTGMLVDLAENNFAQFKFAGAILKHFNHYDDINDETYLSLFSQGEDLLENNYEARCSNMTRYIFENIDFNTIVKKRSENADYLLSELKKMGIDIIEQSKKPLVPMFVPIKICNRDYVRSFFRQHNIFLPVHWPKSNMLESTTDLYDTELSLIVDQRYSISDMKRMLGVLHDSCKNNEYLE